MFAARVKPVTVLLLLTAALLASYLAVPARLSALVYLLLPDDLVRSWFGGNSSPWGLSGQLFVGFAAMLMLAVAYCGGGAALSLLGVQDKLTGLERFVFSMGIGLHGLSLYTLAVGLSGGCRSPVWFGLFAATGIAAFGWQFIRGKRAFRVPREFDKSLLALLPFSLVAFLGGMLPPWDFDVREYHLQAPKEWFQSGSIHFLPHNVYANMPLGAEMPALAAMPLVPGPLKWWWGALVGKTIIATYLPLTAVAIYAAGRRSVSPRAGIIGGLIYVANPSMLHVAMNGLIEGTVAFYGFLALYAALRAQQNRKSPDWRGPSVRFLVVAGWMAGAAVSCKYPAVLFVFIPLIGLTLFASKCFDWKAAAIVAAVTLLACGLWFGKNAALTRNPVYPLCYSVFDGKTRTVEKDLQWQRAHRVPRDASGNRYSPRQLFDSLADVVWRSPLSSILVVPFALLAGFMAPQRRLVLVLACWTAFVFLAWWLFTHRIERFWMPVLPVLAWLGGIGATWSDDVVWRRGITAILVVVLSVQFLTVVALPDNRYFMAFEKLRSDEPIAEGQVSRLPLPHRLLNERVDEVATVLLVGEARPFDLLMPALYNTCFDDCVFEAMFRGKTTQECQEALRAAHVSHILINWKELRRYRSPGNYGYSDYVTPAVVQQLMDRDLFRRVDWGLPAEDYEVFQVPLPADNAPEQSEPR